MPDDFLTNSKIVAAYREKTPGSADCANEAREHFPSGLTHDSRRLRPYGLYVDRAQGSRKWDVDGNEYVDYFGGHGALLLGHNHPVVTAAVHDQVDKGTHYGSGHRLEIDWGGLVKDLLPCAEEVRFVSSGTEANLMALRIARAHTGRDKLLRFKGHFHGWQDHVAFGVSSHYDGTPTPGVLDGIADNVLLAPPDDIDETKRIIEANDDIAAAIIEPTGSSFGRTPVTKEFLAALREITAERGIVLIFDEVVSGFRASPGGAQQVHDIIPDMASLAKIVAGGLPGGAICGTKNLLDHLDFDVADSKGFEKIGHQGTFNANPLSASAGVATLTMVRDETPTQDAIDIANSIRAKVNKVFADEGVKWACYGQFSELHFFLNPDNVDIEPENFEFMHRKCDFFKTNEEIATKFRIGLMVNGVDINGKLAGKVSAVHSEEDADKTADAVRGALDMLRSEGALPS
ncbi:MAG: aspartate aminotransferase family protein [Rhodospirillaceae bacterium]|nr:aspartate aminotransferase family protein [Rhodospirillaceae bacterium]HAA92703.1 aspartate aminotransferase family protein [Rhodospirillaceae bacterium]